MEFPFVFTESKYRDKSRNEQNYEECLKENDVSKTGMKENCIFHEYKNFHVTANKSVDLMHDLLEGVLKYDSPLVLNIYIKEKKLFDYNQFIE